jgi:hypothetical protein
MLLPRRVLTPFLLAAAFVGASPRAIAAQDAARIRPTADDVRTLATIHVAILRLQDSINAAMAQPRNKTAEAQERLQEQLRTHVEALLTARGLDPAEFQRRRYAVSVDGALRQQFDAAVAQLTGTPLPGQTAAVAAPPAAATAAPSRTAAAAATARRAAQPAAGAIDSQPALPTGPMATHIGHVMTGFMDTPGKVGLLPVALAEAKIAAEHAAFAARTPTDLAAMQRHAGHVLHAIDPALASPGPGKGYGFRKAATGVAAHIELAARADGAPAGVKLHAEHVAAAARAAVARADQVVALAGQIRAAETAEAAATLVGQLASLCEQLIAGADLNADGRIVWSGGEGGMQQAEEHLRLLMAAATAR